MVHLNAVMYGLIRSSHPTSTGTVAIGAEADIELRPMLLRRGEEWMVEAVLSGKPRPTIENPLIDTDVIEGPSAFEQFAREASRGLIRALLNSIIYR